MILAKNGQKREYMLSFIFKMYADARRITITSPYVRKR